MAKSPEYKYPIVAYGYAARDTSGTLSPFTFSRRVTGEKDVRHEIVGVVTEIGSKVQKFNIGDKVGVGYFVGSCRSCESCVNDLEQYCTKQVRTICSLNSDGTYTCGGYSDHMVSDEHFVLRWPDNLPLDSGAPLLCAGITSYSPLKYFGLNKPGKKVGVVGLGGVITPYRHEKKRHSSLSAITFGQIAARSRSLFTLTGHPRSKRFVACVLESVGWMSSKKAHVVKLDVVGVTISSSSMVEPRYVSILVFLGRWVSDGVPNGFIARIRVGADHPFLKRWRKELHVIVFFEDPSFLAYETIDDYVPAWTILSNQGGDCGSGLKEAGSTGMIEAYECDEEFV
ncbi:mannitol dehydrogenase-like protein [Tanacetum coccineum]